MHLPIARSFLYTYGVFMELSMNHVVCNRLVMLRKPHEFYYVSWCFYCLDILIGDRIFLRLEPLNYIACHQTLTYRSGYETNFNLRYSPCLSCYSHALNMRVFFNFCQVTSDSDKLVCNTQWAVCESTFVYCTWTIFRVLSTIHTSCAAQ